MGMLACDGTYPDDYRLIKKGGEDVAVFKRIARINKEAAFALMGADPDQHRFLNKGFIIYDCSWGGDLHAVYQGDDTWWILQGRYEVGEKYPELQNRRVGELREKAFYLPDTRIRE